ncbi:hypothetical protein PVK06_019861 [Gossypium arboreum]|uniref:Uncharacterized protein n=1 Tax=Gossypium arboreum TaxID=29729 RepID=A0ABR0PL57_GOSAR|nr:hypothetical protein PVK06_019861 [Gossypium arboreum]
MLDSNCSRELKKPNSSFMIACSGILPTIKRFGVWDESRIHLEPPQTLDGEKVGLRDGEIRPGRIRVGSVTDGSSLDFLLFLKKATLRSIGESEQ